MNRRKFVSDAVAFGATLTLPFPALGEPAQSGKMLMRTIPGTQESLPIVGFGNSQSFRDNDYENSSKLLEVLIEKGGSFVDTGESSQVVIGRYMAEHHAREKLFLGTNVGADPSRDSQTDITEALKLQGRAVLDLLQLARPTDIDAQWRSMRGAKDDGHTRYIGVAIARNSFYDMLETVIESGTSDFVQLNYSMLEPQSGKRLLPLARDHGVAVVVNRPFMNGEYFSLVKDRQLPEWAGEFDCHSWAQFSLKYILANPVVNCVLTETSKTHHAIDNLSAGFGRLPDEKTRNRMMQLMQSF